MPLVRVWSDYVCPYCYVGHALVKRLEAAYPDLEVEWRAFELHPGTPREGAPVEDVLPPAYAGMVRENVKRVADAHGVHDIAHPDFIANSRLAHAATAHAEAHGIGDAFRDAVMRAYWKENRNVGDADVLRDAWHTAGGTADAWRAFRAEADAHDRDFREDAQAAGVHGVPTFDVIGTHRKRRVVGAQPFDVLQRVVDEVLEAEASV